MMYKTTYQPAHPRASKNNGRVYTHILVAEKALGRHLSVENEVHHFDGDKTNNRNDNLVICENRSYHKLLHVRQRIKSAGGDPRIHKFCTICKILCLRSNFGISKCRFDGLDAKCKDCKSYMGKKYWTLTSKRIKG